jgi:protein TonB
MGSYSGQIENPERTKALLGVALVHLCLAAIILTGLNVDTVRRAVQTITTIAIVEPQPPPPPTKERELVEVPTPAKEAGAPGKKAEPTPVVAPKSKLPVPSPIAAAKVAGSGSSPHSGAATAGSGTGNGGSGLGRGGGGTGYTPAKLIRKVPNRAYRQMAYTGVLEGDITLSLIVGADGRVAKCQTARTSGSIIADNRMCELVVSYMLFDPARDPSGRPVAQDVTWVTNWRP